MFAAASNGVPGPDQGVASGLASTGQQIGSAFGLAVLVAIANTATGGPASRATQRLAVAHGLHNAIIAGVLGMALMIAVAFTFGGTSARSGDSSGTEDR